MTKSFHDCDICNIHDATRTHRNEEAIKHIREYLEVMRNEPEGFIKLSEVYSSIKRMLPDE